MTVLLRLKHNICRIGDSLANLPPKSLVLYTDTQLITLRLSLAVINMKINMRQDSVDVLYTDL